MNGENSDRTTASPPRTAHLPSMLEASEWDFPQLSRAIQSCLDAVRNRQNHSVTQVEIESLIEILQKKIAESPQPPQQPKLPPTPELPPEPLAEPPYTPSARYKEVEAKYNRAIAKLNKKLSRGRIIASARDTRLEQIRKQFTKEFLKIKLSEWPPVVVEEWKRMQSEHDEWARTVRTLMRPVKDQEAKLKKMYRIEYETWCVAMNEWKTRTEIPFRIVSRLKKETKEAFAGTGNFYAIEKLPWRFLPPGETGEERVLAELQNFCHRHPELKIDGSRLRFAYSLSPKHVYVGEDEFDGYFAFVFPFTRRVLLENPVEGNGAYVFAGDWKFLSKLPRMELLHFHGHEVRRAIHRGDWKTRVRRFLGIRR